MHWKKRQQRARLRRKYAHFIYARRVARKALRILQDPSASAMERFLARHTLWRLDEMEMLLLYPDPLGPYAGLRL